jgi:sporulation protein YlmC with PRC-barrel domain
VHLFYWERKMLKVASATALIAMLGVGGALAASNTASSIPSGAKTVTDWYKQSVYDRHESKIGSVDDVLLDESGKITTLVIGVGGFLGAGEKDVAVPFNAVQQTKKKDEWYLVMDTDKDSLKNAQGFKYDKTKTTWVATEK